MYKKLGSYFETGEGKETPHLKSQDGKVYKVTPIVAFVWDKLDGETSLDTITTQIKKILEPDEASREKNISPELDSVSKEIVTELEKINLVAEV